MSSQCGHHIFLKGSEGSKEVVFLTNYFCLAVSKQQIMLGTDAGVKD